MNWSTRRVWRARQAKKRLLSAAQRPHAGDSQAAKANQAYAEHQDRRDVDQRDQAADVLRAGEAPDVGCATEGSGLSVDRGGHLANKQRI